MLFIGTLRYLTSPHKQHKWPYVLFVFVFTLIFIAVSNRFTCLIRCLNLLNRLQNTEALGQNYFVFETLSAAFSGIRTRVALKGPLVFLHISLLLGDILY